jgi:amino acid adenylation domain-containing protein
VQDYAGSIVHFQLDEALSAALRALCRRHGTTLFMTLLAGWGALLSRLSGQGDVVIGTPVANRHRAEIEPLIGFFVNTQALRIDLSGSPSVAQLLAQVRATALAAQAHQDIPFEQVVEALSPIRSMAHSPVFQVMFAWQNAPEGSLDLPGLQLEPVSASSTTVKFDLELTLHDAGERIAGSLGYACALFDRSSIERHLGHWQTLLRAFIADDAAPVARLPLLTVPEQRHLLHSFNDTFAAFPQDRCIHQLFEEQVARTPDTTALVFEGASLTYRELNAQANRLAHHLIALGVRPDSRVAIALPRGIDMVVALLATLKAGGAYVPLDRDYPSERLVFMLADSSPCVLITDTATRSALGDMRDAPAVLQLDADRSWQSMSSTNPDPAVLGLTTSHLAYVIYTSGSTGQPKGAMNEHRGVVNRLLWMQQAYGLNATDAVLQKTAFGFDVSVWEFFWPLLAGARLVLARPQGQRDVTYLVDLIERERITTLHFVPSMLSAFLAAMPRSSGSSLRRVICSGEALEPHQVNLVHEQLAHARLYNLYGPTEAAIDVTAGEPQRDHLVTIGAPIANTRIFILDALGQPAPVGVAGEIHIAGVQVARGYLGRPALTAERFVPDPFGAPGSRMYKTGDLGRWQLDGSIEFLGRNDHQVKVRGFRIELGEIEAALCSHTDVRDAVVLAREDVPGDQRLVAYVIGAATPEALRAHLGSQLPQYMVPAAYVPLDALPLTSNGKLDRAALPAPDDPVRSNRYEPPRIGIERVLAKVWSKVLNLAVICREDHFFELGGHSLLAVQLVALVKQRGLGLTLQDVYAYPTLRAQSERLLGAEHSSDTRALAVRRTGTAPTLFALPTGLGDVTYAFELAAHLDTHAPVYALPWPDVMPQSMEALAAHMVQVMRVVQPAGPYRLLGYSSGALLAYAIAQLLAEQDEPVDFIGMLDCEHHTKHDDAKSPEEMARQWLLHELTIAEQTFGEHEEVRQVLRQLADDVPGTPWNELIARYEHHDSLRALTEQRHSNARQVATTYLRTALFQKLWLSYATRALPAPLKLHVFYATEGTAPQHPMGWQELMPSDQLVVVPVPGTHTSMMEPPHIGHVGRAVSQALRHIRSAPARDAEDRGDVRFHLRPTFMPQAQVENLDAANNPER